MDGFCDSKIVKNTVGFSRNHMKREHVSSITSSARPNVSSF